LPKYIGAATQAEGKQIIGCTFSKSEEDLLVFVEETSEILSEEKGVPTRYNLIKSFLMFNK